ncbi:alpha/beta fold hydrolase [Hymenobacter humi]|uniref:Alpha/beta fold hydrolase n=1 Tax=Hymenobacter humi TaxID=1411620 RepID=A0ABW2UFJ8_9BACT
MNLFRLTWPLGCACILSLALLVSPAKSAGQNVAHRAGKIHTEQVDLGYEILGESPSAVPLLVVNGGPGLSHAYLLPTDVWGQLARKRRVIFYDQRGTGTSRPVRAGAPQTLAAQVADLEALRQGLGLPKIILIGDSYGGLLSIAYASAYPEHIARLVLSAAAGSSLNDVVHLFDQVFPDAMAQQKQAQKPGAPKTREAAEASLRRHFNLIFYSLEQRDRYFQRVGPMANLGFEEAVADAVGTDAAKQDFTPKLASFRFPTLVLSGRYDMNVAPLTAWRLKEAIPGARIVFFEKSGHFPWFEEPEKYRAVVEAFLAGQK